ncbi:MAG TPA: 50S ribosome-binding GTPase [Geminocystis sp. M7585_C2015_104]|nr:50S ribosome-binding GTPase [Geminocystis sp. M7585_C2015_104]
MSCHSCSGSKCKSSWWASVSKTHFPEKVVALVGMPNVGKSVLFNALTGTYVTVSNYPGTTVEIARGKTQIGEKYVSVVDTPGMYSLIPITEEEKVAKKLLLEENLSLAIHVVEAKNLGRMLTLTLQLMEMGLPLLLAVNMIDEAKRMNIAIDSLSLEEKLGIPVVKMSAAKKQGIEQLKMRMAAYV